MRDFQRIPHIRITFWAISKKSFLLYHDLVQPRLLFVPVELLNVLVMKIEIKIEKEEKQRTFILFWNPAISSCKMEDYQKLLENRWEPMIWSVWDYRQALIGDRFFMVRCGDGKTGICMSGTFNSMPFYGKDWSGQGRDNIHYIDLDRDVVINPDYCPILTTAELQAAIPDFDWTGGHSGRLLDPKSAEKLEEMWDEFLEKNADIFHTRAVRFDVDEDEDDDEFEEE